MANAKQIVKQLKDAVIADANRPAEEREIWHRAVNVVLYQQKLFGDDLHAEMMAFIAEHDIQLPNAEELAAADAKRAEEKKANLEKQMALLLAQEEAAKAAANEEWDDCEAYEYI